MASLSGTIKRTRISWYANWERIKWRRCRGKCQLHSDIIPYYLWFSSKVWWFFFHFTCSYFNISFNLVLVHFSLFVVLFSFVFVFVTVDTSCVCQIGYEIVEEGLLNVKHLITRNWNWAWISWKLHLKISIVTMVTRAIPMHSDQWGTACIHLVWVHHHV